jgi:hypothetical protein
MARQQLKYFAFCDAKVSKTEGRVLAPITNIQQQLQVF